jgi:hypothetical protein
VLRRHLPRAAALTLALAGCADPAPAPGDGGVDAAPLPATYANVQPVLARACSFRSCHGGTSTSGGLNLGASAAESHAALVNVASTQVPAMRRVLPGDPAMSWLMHKVDNTMGTVAACRAAGAMCGVSMPERADLLPAAERDLLRRWIAAGAPGP